MTTQENVQTADTAAVDTNTVVAEPVIFFGKDFAEISSKAGATTAKVLEEALKQFALQVNNSKSEDKITIEGSTVEELQAKLAEHMMKQANAARKPEEITLLNATITDILKHKSEELGAFLFDMFAETAIQVKGTGTTTGKGKGTRKSNKPRQVSLYALQVEGVHSGKPFLVLSTGAFTLEMKEVVKQIEAAGITADFQKKNPKGETTWDKAKILEAFGKKVELTSDEIHAQFEGKGANITIDKLGDKMPKLTTKKVEAKKK